MYNAAEIKQCFISCGYKRKLANEGDSLGREVFTNELGIAHVSGVDGRKFKIDTAHGWKSSSQAGHGLPPGIGNGMDSDILGRVRDS